MSYRIVSIILFIVSSLSLKAQPLSQFTPGQLWKDDTGTHINAHGGGILFRQGVYYWYGEHKVGGDLGNTAQVGVSCYSSKDLYNWKNEGIALKVNESDPENDIAKGCILERPKVIYNALTNKYVMWFHLELKGKGYDAARGGVAVSDRPTGPFTYVRSFRPNAGYWPVNVMPSHQKPVASWVKSAYCGGKGCLPASPDSVNLLGRDFKGGQMARDMNLFVDEDGSAYHIYSSEENSTLHISRLTADYQSFSGVYIRLFSGRYIEGAHLFKRKGKYYISARDCTGWEPNMARSAVSDTIFGNWTELGNPCQGEDAALTFHSQSTFVLPIQGKGNSFIFMADRWNPKDAIDGRHVWLPIDFEGEKPVIHWHDQWSYDKGK